VACRCALVERHLAGDVADNQPAADDPKPQIHPEVQEQRPDQCPNDHMSAPPGGGRSPVAGSKARKPSGHRTNVARRRVPVTCQWIGWISAVRRLGRSAFGGEFMPEDLRSYVRGHLVDLEGRCVSGVGGAGDLHNGVPGGSWSRSGFLRQWRAERAGPRGTDPGHARPRQAVRTCRGEAPDGQQRPASPFVISNAVRGTWLGPGTPPSGGPDRRIRRRLMAQTPDVGPERGSAVTGGGRR
jgi:hypothetical protein